DARAIVERHAIAVIDSYSPMSATELAVIEVPEEPYLLRPHITRGGLNLIAGDIGAGKTWALQDLALGVATGSKAWGVQPTVQGGVLLLSADQSRDDDHRRLLDLCAGRGIKPPANCWFDHDLWDFTKRASFGKLRRFIQARGIVLLGIDAAVRYFAGDGNDASEVSVLMRGLRDLANATGVTIVLLHHLSKPNQITRPRLADRVRGSGDWLAAVDSGLVLITEGTADNRVRHMVQIKNRAGPEAASLTFEIEPLEMGGLVLTFGAGDDATTSSSLADIAADAMLLILREAPGKTLTRAELVASLASQGVNVATRTLVKATASLGRLPGVKVTKLGRANVYAYT
ncbi:MAG: AAA family ATPase, partial [Chloroflexi bacterium]|nr:AAA family ATPase [Chloroflexota bacterium]